MLLDLCRDELGSATVQSSSSMTSSGSSCGRCSSFSPRPSSSSSSAAGSTPPAAAAAAAPGGSSDTENSSIAAAVALDDVPRRLLSLPSRKPHRSSDPAWAAIRGLGSADVGPRDFKLVRRLGSGDVGTVYLCRLRDDGDRHQCSSPPFYAMKVVDKRELAGKKKLGRAEAERRVLAALDHPFLPTLYADFDAPPHYSCAVMEFCPGGDLHSLRHRQPSKCFPLHAVRFYAAEVLMALEYLHMLGFIYRDLKPENVLIRSDGHIMISDFDLSLEATASPAVRHCSPDNSSVYASPASPSSNSDPRRRPRRHSCLPSRRVRRFVRFWRRSPTPEGAAVGKVDGGLAEEAGEGCFLRKFPASPVGEASRSLPFSTRLRPSSDPNPNPIRKMAGFRIRVGSLLLDFGSGFGSPKIRPGSDPGRTDAKGSATAWAVPGGLSRSRSTRSYSSAATSRLFVAEPVEARSSSFVGTHEYVAPEVASGDCHGAAVDWWAYGVFLYELAYGRTPFAGPTNPATLRNIVRTPLSFPGQQPSDPRLKDLISRLLEKDPARRLGSALGAAEVKAHPFFEGLNFALLRSQRPPVVPGSSSRPARSKSCRERQQPRRADPGLSSLDLWF